MPDNFPRIGIESSVWERRTGWTTDRVATGEASLKGVTDSPKPKGVLRKGGITHGRTQRTGEKGDRLGELLRSPEAVIE